eukprot:jgi/Galph1/1370/GphlegSOOS_G6053.1
MLSKQKIDDTLKYLEPLMKPALPFISNGVQMGSLVTLCFLASCGSSSTCFIYSSFFWNLAIPFLCFYTFQLLGNLLFGVISSIHGRNRTLMVALISVLVGDLFILGTIPFTLKLVPIHAVAFSFIGFGSCAVGACAMPNILESIEKDIRLERNRELIVVTRVSEYFGFSTVCAWNIFSYLLFGEKYRRWIVFLVFAVSFGLHVGSILFISEGKESTLFQSSMTSHKLNFLKLLKEMFVVVQHYWRYIPLLCLIPLVLTANSLSLWFVLLAENTSWLERAGRLFFLIILLVFAVSRLVTCWIIPTVLEKFAYSHLLFYCSLLLVGMEVAQFLLNLRMFSLLVAISYIILYPIILTVIELVLSYSVPTWVRSSWIGFFNGMGSLGAFSVIIPILVLLRPSKVAMMERDGVNKMRFSFLILWMLLVIYEYYCMNYIHSHHTSLRIVDEQYPTSQKSEKEN